MRIDHYALHRYSLPFTSPFITANATYTHRTGFIVSVQSEGKTGYGEVAPLPNYSPDTEVSCLQSLKIFGQSCQAEKSLPLEEWLELIHAMTPRTPAARFGLETAFFDISAQQESKPLATYLNTNCEESVPVNALYTSPFNLPEGITTVKMKIQGRTLTEDLDAILDVIDELGDSIRVRFDVNGTWKLRTAVEVCKALEGLNIDYIEQPLSAESLEDLAQLRQSTSIPIAVDESLTDVASAKQILDCGAADVLVLKPAVTGSYEDATVIIGLARENGLRVVVTHTLEATPGRLANLHLACANGIKEPCGFLTGFLLTEICTDFPSQKNGHLEFPKSPGLGFGGTLI